MAQRTQKDFFERLGAPLANARWSWGAIRSSDGTVFLRVWQDRTRKHEGCLYVKITHTQNFIHDPDNLGHQERLRHFKQIRQGASCYLVMCQPEDDDSGVRKVKDFNEEYVRPGGKLVELDGDWWIELLPRVPVRNVAETDKRTGAGRHIGS